MTKYCKTHVSERTADELRGRLEELNIRSLSKPLTKGLEAERERVLQELMRRGRQRQDEELAADFVEVLRTNAMLGGERVDPSRFRRPDRPPSQEPSQTQKELEEVRDKIQAACDDYSWVFRPPFDWSPNLKLATQALAVAERLAEELEEVQRLRAAQARKALHAVDEFTSNGTWGNGSGQFGTTS